LAGFPEKLGAKLLAGLNVDAIETLSSEFWQQPVVKDDTIVGCGSRAAVARR